MTTNIDKRKNIIISLKSYYGERKKGIDKQIQFLKKSNFMHILISIFCFGFLMTSIISEQLDYEFFKWQKTGLLSLLSLMAFLNLPNGIFELKLLTHFKKINEYKDFNGIEKLNDDLKFQIDKLNNRIGTNIIPLVLGVLILIMGAWQTMSENNPYWEYMKIPIILFFGFIIIRFIIVNKKLTENIRKVEKYCCQHRIKFMLKSDLVQTDKHSIKILLRRKNLRFLRRTNHNTKPLCPIKKNDRN